MREKVTRRLLWILVLGVSAAMTSLTLKSFAAELPLDEEVARALTGGLLWYECVGPTSCSNSINAVACAGYKNCPPAACGSRTCAASCPNEFSNTIYACREAWWETCTLGPKDLNCGTGESGTCSFSYQQLSEACNQCVPALGGCSGNGGSYDCGNATTTCQ